MTTTVTNKTYLRALIAAAETYRFDPATPRTLVEAHVAAIARTMVRQREARHSCR